MDDTKDNRHFHLVRVVKDQGIIRTVPHGVHTKGVNVSRWLCHDKPCRIGRPFPSGLPQVKRLGKDVVVHETGKDRKDAHENN